MTIYYSPSARGFFHAAVHGPRRILVADPAWVAPEQEEGEELAEAPMIEIDNPACQVPADAVEITEQEHADLMAAQAHGKQLEHDDEGRPVAIDRPEPTADELAAAARARRDSLLSASDWTQARDIPQALAAQWAPYRQALRDWPTQKGFPDLSTLPTKPA